MINGKTISLVVPCRNEEGIIAGFIRKVPAYVDEVLIVDNNSTDRTALVARKNGARVISEPRIDSDGVGYGFAHQTGLRQASGDFIVTMDGDDTYPVKAIAPIITQMEKQELDVVSCNRLPLTNLRAISKLRQLGIAILNFETRLLFGYPIRDILTGMWVIRKSKADLLNVTEGGWNYSPQIKLEAITNPHIRFAERHILHFARTGEPSKQNLIKTGITHAWFFMAQWLKRYNPAIRLSRSLANAAMSLFI